MNESVSVLMVGVGGQGIVLAGNILCAAALNAGYDVKKSEIHGMAQRGGSVVSHVRIGKKVNSPVIPLAGADIILSFEKMEFIRYLEFVNKDTILIVNDRKILPPSVASGVATYPDDKIAELLKLFSKVIIIDADKTASESGNVKAGGMAVLGCMSVMLDIDEKAWGKAITEYAPQKTVIVNTVVFHKGKSMY